MNTLARRAMAAAVIAAAAGAGGVVRAQGPTAPAAQGAAPQAADASVRLMGRGERRATLDALMYKPFDAARLGALSGWAGTPVTADAIKGRPALIVAWASWFKGSHRGLSDAQRLADDPEFKDLVVVLVHHRNDPSKAKETLDAEKVKVPSAHDASGDFFKALSIDGAGPSYYIVDRAGNLRFADLERSSLTQAVRIVTAETADDAAKAPERAAQAKKTREAEAAGTPMGGPAVKDRPPAEAYAKAAWPKPAKRVDYAKNVQGKPLPVALGKETWLTEQKDLTGKIVVVDFWATWCGPCIAASPILDEIQTKHKDALVVLGVSGQGDKADEIKAFLKKKKPGYSHVFDGKQAVYNSLSIRGIPHVLVLSTDGVVRWQGNPHESEFKKVVDDVVAADPWVQAKAKK